MVSDLTFRLATEKDLSVIITMLADDPLGALREKLAEPPPDTYSNALKRIQADTNQELTVAEIDGEIVGTFQLTIIQYLTHQGGLRAQLEAVRIKSTYRGNRIGTAMFQYAIARARQRGCYVVQLTTDKQRPRAVQFYESLGFVATHEGMKLTL